MIGFDVDIDDLLRRNSTLLLFLPAAIFGYLFHLIGDLVFLWWGGGWAILVALQFGVGKSIHYPILQSDLSLPRWYNIEHALWWVTMIVYALYVGPTAILAALNNLLPEHQEINIVSDPFWHLTSIPHGAIATNDLLLVALLGVHLISYVVMVGPVILLTLIVAVWVAMKDVGKVLLWIFVRLWPLVETVSRRF